MKTLSTTVMPAWHRKSGVERLVSKVLFGLATMAAGNSGYHCLMHLN